VLAGGRDPHRRQINMQPAGVSAEPLARSGSQHVVDRDEIGMAQRGADQRFAMHPRMPTRIPERMHALERYQAPQGRVLGRTTVAVPPEPSDEISR